jgi:hypothetical protein
VWSRLESGDAVNNNFFFFRCDGAFFFRVFGYGLHVKDITMHRAYFSERNGFPKYWQVGKWRVRILKRGV